MNIRQLALNLLLKMRYSMSLCPLLQILIPSLTWRIQIIISKKQTARHCFIFFCLALILLAQNTQREIKMESWSYLDRISNENLIL